MDTGINKKLVEIYDDRIVNPYNFLNNSTNISDANGHGTNIICIATCDYKTTGIYGIAPKAKIMPLVVMNEKGLAHVENIARGIIYATDNGANIINLSFGSRIDNIEVKNEIDYAYKNNVIVVASVGDYNENEIVFPSKYEKVIALAAQTKSRQLYSMSNYNAGNDVFLPGEAIKTLGINNTTNELEFIFLNGSSVATSLISGVLALFLNDIENEIYLKYNITRNQPDELLDIEKFINGKNYEEVQRKDINE